MDNQQVDDLTGTSDRAFCTGYVQLYFEPINPTDPGLVWPSHDELHQQIAPVVLQVLQTPTNMNTVLAITKASVHNMPEEGALAHEVNLHFQASLVNGPAQAIDNLKASGATLSSQFKLAMGSLPWASHVTVHKYVSLTYTMKVSGEQVVQRIGQKRGGTEDYDGTEPVELENPVDLEDAIVGPGGATITAGATTTVPR